MGPMAQGFDRRKVVKLAAFSIVTLFAWSLIAAPSSSGQAEAAPVEPENLSAYYTFGDAVPIAGYTDVEAAGLPAFGPALAHTFTQVGLPSQASADGFLTDFGIANTVNGTTTGTFVPTEASARQPGGNPKAEFTTAGGPIGNDQFARAAAGVVRATAEQSDAPQANSNAYLGNVYILPGSGSPPDAPGTYNPDDTFPGGPSGAPTPDPGPHNQTAILSIGSVASNSKSIREADTVTSFGVAEINDITIGNRTAENICAQCISIDALRVEAYARSNGQPGGSKAAYRVFIGRACYRSATGAKESDQCIAPPGQEALTQINTDQLNAFFENPMFLPVKCANNTPCTVGIRVHAGTNYADPQRPLRASNPPEDACRNYAYPDTSKGAKQIQACKDNGTPETGPDQSQGQEAKAVAEGINIDILTLTGTQFIPPNADLDACFNNQVPQQVKDATVPVAVPTGAPIPAGKPGYQYLHNLAGCPIPAVRQVRDLNLTLGIAVANAVARPAFVFNGGGGGGGGGVVPPVSIPVPPIGPGPIGGTTTGGPVVNGGGGGGGIGAGPLRLHIDWKSLRIKPWKAKDMAKGLFALGIIAGMIALIRRRLRLAGK